MLRGMSPSIHPDWLRHPRADRWPTLQVSPGLVTAWLGIIGNQAHFESAHIICTLAPRRMWVRNAGLSYQWLASLSCAARRLHLRTLRLAADSIDLAVLWIWPNPLRLLRRQPQELQELREARVPKARVLGKQLLRALPGVQPAERHG